MKTALIFGSSGLIGSNFLNQIIKEKIYSKIKLFLRSPANINNPLIETIYTDFINLNEITEYIKGDDCYFCIGTTRKDTPNKAEYRRIEYNLPVEIAKISKKNLVSSFLYISSMGANIKASNSYLQNKGQVEDELIKLNFSKLSILRPSLLLGTRKNFRLGEKIMQFVMTRINFIFIRKLQKFRPIKAKNIAKSMIKIININYKIRIFESDKLEYISKN